MKSKYLFIVLIVIVVILIIAARQCRKTPVAVSPITIVNSDGEKTDKFDLLETVLVSAEKLRPSTHYDVRLTRSDGVEISHARLTTDTKGIIPASPIWYDIGVKYEKGSRTGTLELDEALKYDYTVAVSGPGAEFSAPFKVEMKKPAIFSTDKNGRPLNGFIKGKEDVYAVGKNFPAGSAVRLYVVDDRHSWSQGDAFIPAKAEYITVQLSPKESEFKVRVWDKHRTRIGSYDIVAVSLSGKVRTYTIDSGYNVGFVIQDEPGADDIEQQVTCQVPSPPPPAAPNPKYKDSFATGEAVWVAVNPYTQGKNYVGQNARIYVINHLPKTSYVHGMSLSDVSGGYEETVIQPGCANVNYTLVWPNPSPGKYDVIIDFAPFGVYDKGTDIVDMLDPIGLLVGTPDIEVSSIQFNWGAGSGAVNLQDNVTNSPVPVPEWDKGTNVNEPAAYVRGSSMTVKAKFHKNQSGAPDTVVAWAELGSGMSLAPQTVTFGGASDSVYIDFTTSSPLPGYIKKHELVWQWYFATPPYPGSVQNPMNATTHTICTTFKTPLVNPAYKKTMLWTSEWARYLSDDKAIVDAIIGSLHLSGLKYGVSGWDIDTMLDNGGGMCGGWRKMFAHMAGCQGVQVEQRCYILKNDAAASPEIKWDSIVIKDGGLNQTEPTFSAATYIDVDSVYPNPAPGDITVRNEKRYRFYAPGDGHCINFLNYSGKVYLYDPSFGKGPFADTFTSIPSGTTTGAALTNFRAKYHDAAIDYMMGNIKKSDNSYQYLTIKTGLISDLRIPGDPGSYEIHYEWF